MRRPTANAVYTGSTAVFTPRPELPLPSTTGPELTLIPAISTPNFSSGGTMPLSYGFTSAGPATGGSGGFLTDILTKGAEIGFDYLRGRVQSSYTRMPPMPQQPVEKVLEPSPGGPGIQSRGYDIHLPRQKRRSMNIANVKALRRATRRVEGFAKLAKRTIQFTQRVKLKKRRAKSCR